MSIQQQAIIDRLSADYEQLLAAYTALAGESPQPFFRKLDKYQIERALREPVKVIHQNGEVVLTTNS